MKIKIKDKNGITLNTEKKYCKENIKITLDQEGLKDLKPENIASGVCILGIDGTANAIRTTANATAKNILKGKTAYVDGEKITGTLEMGTYTKSFTGYGETVTKAIVIFNTQGICEAPPSLIGVTNLPTQLPILNLKDKDYTFGGWFLDEALTQAATPGMTLTTDIVLFAKLTANFSTGLTVNSTVTELRGCGSCGDTNIICPPTIKTIKQNAFEDETITSFKIGKNLISIGKNAFYNCHQLNSFIAPANCKLQTFEIGVFENCVKLRTVYIPKSVLYIGPRVFEYCITLSDVYYEGTESD
jgi:hypothetical protein